MRQFDHFKGYLLLTFAMLIYSFTAITNKMASRNKVLSSGWILFYGIGILLLCIYACVWQQVLKKMELGKAYTGKALATVLEFLWGWIIFKEQINLQMIIGGTIVIIGVIIVAMEKGGD